MGNADSKAGRTLGLAVRSGRGSHLVFRGLERTQSGGLLDGGQDGYFRLYRCTAAAIKGVDASIKVGGPATADNKWIPEFLAFCRTNAVPVDFVSTHHYPTDAFGTPGADTVTQLQHAPRGMMRAQASDRAPGGG